MTAQLNGRTTAEDNANPPAAQGLQHGKWFTARMLAVRISPRPRCWLTRWALAPIAAGILSAGCDTPRAEPVPQEVVVWKKLGEWSGNGNAQTESFIGLTGALRMRWRTKNEAPKGAGTFRLILQSSISGRALQEPVDETGTGEGEAYVAEDPRGFYMSVESANLDWSFTVEEAVFGTAAGPPPDPD